LSVLSSIAWHIMRLSVAAADFRELFDISTSLVNLEFLELGLGV